MRTFSRVTLVTMLLGAGGWTASFSSARGVDRSPQEIVKELDDIKIPTLDASKKKDRSLRHSIPEQASEGDEEA